MYNTNQIAEFGKANVEQATKFAAIALQNIDKVFQANVEAVKFALAQGVERANESVKVKDVESFTTTRAKYAETDVQAAIAYSRNLYEIAQQTQAQYTAVSQEAIARFTTAFEGWQAQATKGDNPAVNAFKSTVAAAQAAFAQFQKATNDAVALAA
jgi:phasin family protein